MKSKEPVVAYNSDSHLLETNADIQSLRTQVIEAVDSTEDQNLLLFCLSSLRGNISIPCCFDDSQLKREINRSLKSGVASDEEVLRYYEKWHA